MAKIFETIANAFKPKKPVAHAETAPVQADEKFDFVEQYTLIDPKLLFNGGYDLWSLCKTVPVAYENESREKGTGFAQCVELPTHKPIMEFLYQLEHAAPAIVKQPKNRTISIIHFGKGKRMFIVPDLNHPKNPFFIVDFETGNEREWFLHVTPQINRAIVKQLKIVTR